MGVTAVQTSYKIVCSYYATKDLKRPVEYQRNDLWHSNVSHHSSKSDLSYKIANDYINLYRCH